mgnify:CR=1 FL=1
MKANQLLDLLSRIALLKKLKEEDKECEQKTIESITELLTKPPLFSGIDSETFIKRVTNETETCRSEINEYIKKLPS